jgi:thiol-disulfide isomerase/thioredoxin
VALQGAALGDRWQVPTVVLADLLPPEGTDPAVDGDLALTQVRRRLEQPDAMLQGWVLADFPTTLAQAEAFEDWWAKFGKAPAPVVYLKAMTGVLMNRLAAQSSAAAPALRRRIEAHRAAVQPLLDYYQGRSQLVTINANQSFAEVAAAIAQLGETETGAVQLLPSEAELDRRLAETEYLVVDCMASWCGSCKQIAPALDRLAETYGDRVPVVKIDFDHNRNLTKRFGLQGIPAVMFFRRGTLQATLTGVKAYGEYSAATDRLLALGRVREE